MKNILCLLLLFSCLALSAQNDRLGANLFGITVTLVSGDTYEVQGNYNDPTGVTTGNDLLTGDVLWTAGLSSGDTCRVMVITSIVTAFAGYVVFEVDTNGQGMPSTTDSKLMRLTTENALSYIPISGNEALLECISQYFSYQMDVFSGGGGTLASIVAGTNTTVDNTDPANPIINVPSLNDADADPSNEIQTAAQVDIDTILTLPAATNVQNALEEAGANINALAFSIPTNVSDLTNDVPYVAAATMNDSMLVVRDSLAAIRGDLVVQFVQSATPTGMKAGDVWRKTGAGAGYLIYINSTWTRIHETIEQLIVNGGSTVNGILDEVIELTFRDEDGDLGEWLLGENLTTGNLQVGAYGGITSGFIFRKDAATNSAIDVMRRQDITLTNTLFNGNNAGNYPITNLNRLEYTSRNADGIVWETSEDGVSGDFEIWSAATDYKFPVEAQSNTDPDDVIRKKNLVADNIVATPFGSITATNVQDQLEQVAAGSATGLNVGRVWYVSENGNNATAAVGNPFFPYRDPWYMQDSLRNNDIIQIGKGNYKIGASGCTDCQLIPVSTSDSSLVINLRVDSLYVTMAPGARIISDVPTDFPFGLFDDRGFPKFVSVSGQGQFLCYGQGRVAPVWMAKNGSSVIFEADNSLEFYQGSNSYHTGYLSDGKIKIRTINASGNQSFLTRINSYQEILINVDLVVDTSSVNTGYDAIYRPIVSGAASSFLQSVRIGSVYSRSTGKGIRIDGGANLFTDARISFTIDNFDAPNYDYLFSISGAYKNSNVELNIGRLRTASLGFWQSRENSRSSSFILDCKDCISTSGIDYTLGTTTDSLRFIVKGNYTVDDTFYTKSSANGDVYIQFSGVYKRTTSGPLINSAEDVRLFDAYLENSDNSDLITAPSPITCYVCNSNVKQTNVGANVTVVDVCSKMWLSETFTATAAQTNFTVTPAKLPILSPNLVVLVDGLEKDITTHYTYVAATGVVTFVTPMVGGEVVKIRWYD